MCGADTEFWSRDQMYDLTVQLYKTHNANIYTSVPLVGMSEFERKEKEKRGGRDLRQYNLSIVRTARELCIYLDRQYNLY